MADTISGQEGNLPRKKLKQPTILSQTTIRRPAFFYLHLTLLAAPKLSSADPVPPMDPLTARTHLNSALERFLGLTGSAIPVDILKCEGADVWIRVPNEDGSAVVEAVSGWVSESDDVAWRIRGSGVWLAGLGLGGGGDLFK